MVKCSKCSNQISERILEKWPTAKICATCATKTLDDLMRESSACDNATDGIEATS